MSEEANMAPSVSNRKLTRGNINVPTNLLHMLLLIIYVRNGLAPGTSEYDIAIGTITDVAIITTIAAESVRIISMEPSIEIGLQCIDSSVDLRGHE